ncbi:MAG: hypothetical protein ACI9WU_001084 [Myxococcota bacterium]
MLVPFFLGCDPAVSAIPEELEFPPIPVVDFGPVLATLDCRPVDQAWQPGGQLLLPCEPTFEPCDGVDNDNDGFVDPHCPTIPCSSDADCTYGGVLPDADCNQTADQGPVCNQIDGGWGAPKCQGMLCPPGSKCVGGDCIEPGTGAPNSECRTGADCPIASGCIPPEFVEVGPDGSFPGLCRTFCHDFPCPEGSLCLTEAANENGHYTETAQCALVFGCREALYLCYDKIAACTADVDCPLGQCILDECDEYSDRDCILTCATKVITDEAAAELSQCVLSACAAE